MTVEDRELVRVELRSGDSGASDTTFSLFVDPRSMLVERIEGKEWLPGGLHHQTTIQIEARDLDSSAASPREENLESGPIPIDESTRSETSDSPRRPGG